MPYKVRYTALDPYMVTSYRIPEELRSLKRRVKKSVRTCEITYTKDMVMYTHKAIYTHYVVFTALQSCI